MTVKMDKIIRGDGEVAMTRLIHARNLILIVLLSLSVLWSGCVPSEPSKQQCQVKEGGAMTTEKDEDGKKKTDESAMKKGDEAWQYTAAYKNDPFVMLTPSIEGEEAEGLFAVEQMTLYGIMIAKERGESVAFIKLPDGTDVIVREGDILGKRNGVVKQIREDAIVVEEVYVTPDPNDPKIYTIFYHEKKLPLVQVIE